MTKRRCIVHRGLNNSARPIVPQEGFLVIGAEYKGAVTMHLWKYSPRSIVRWICRWIVNTVEM